MVYETVVDEDPVDGNPTCGFVETLAWVSKKLINTCTSWHFLPFGITIQGREPKNKN